MSDRSSRVNKFEKRRKNTKHISILIVVGIILIIILLGFWMFGGSSSDDDSNNAQPETNEENNNEQGNDDSDTSTDDFTINEDKQDNDENESENDNENNDDNDSDDVSIPSDDVDIEEIEDPDDDNVEKAYNGDWKSIGTSQSEPHEVQYDKESEDWKEMEEAIKYATGLTDMTTHWIGNDGDQKVVGTVTNPDNTEIYRVYLSWQTDDGWQPTKVEILKELDQG